MINLRPTYTSPYHFSFDIPWHRSWFKIHDNTSSLCMCVCALVEAVSKRKAPRPGSLCCCRPFVASLRCASMSVEAPTRCHASSMLSVMVLGRCASSLAQRGGPSREGPANFTVAAVQANRESQFHHGSQSSLTRSLTIIDGWRVPFHIISLYISGSGWSPVKNISASQPTIPKYWSNHQRV